MTVPRPEPIYFGRATQPLAGWLHRPATDAAPRVGVVLCPPLFHESLASHRTVRRLADAVAARGLPALRFDYAGMRDSAAGVTDADQLSSWTDSVRAAIETMKTASAVDQVCVLGIRAGAALALLATAGRADVAGLVAIAPVVSGRKYLRELRAFGLPSSTDGTPGPFVDPNGIGGGFVLTAETRAAIGALDLLTLQMPAPPHVLLVDRRDMPSDGAWATHLRNRGSIVDLWQMGGFADMMLDPHMSVVPDDMVRTVADWLADDDAHAIEAPQPASGRKPVPVLRSMRLSVARGDHETNTIQETARHLDADGTLFGIVTEPLPDARPASDRRMVFILLNAGAVHHVGPGSLYVALARRWAARGHVVIRMDLSGLGDSATRSGAADNVVYSPRAIEDIAAAVAFVRREYSGARCYAAGICSGAYHAFKAAVAGVGLDGVIAVNPLTFFWRDGMTFDSNPAEIIKASVRHRAAARQFDAWRRLFAGRIHVADAAGQVLRRALTVSVEWLREVARLLHIPLPDDLAAELKRVAQRKIDLLFVFAAGDPGHQLLIEEGGATVGALSRRGALRIAVIERADHVFTSQSSKDRLIALLTGDLVTRPVPSATDAAAAAWRLHDQSAIRHP